MNRRGLTLIEMLIVGMMLTLVAGALCILAQTGGQIWTRTDAQLASQTMAQQVVDHLAEDLRMASAGSVTCTVPTGDAITMNRFDPVTRAMVLLRYTYNGTTLFREGSPIASQVTQFVSTCPERGRVTIAVTVQTGPSATHTLTSQVWVRNP